MIRGLVEIIDQSQIVFSINVKFKSVNNSTPQTKQDKNVQIFVHFSYLSTHTNCGVRIDHSTQSQSHAN